MIKEVLPHMREQGSGMIINIIDCSQRSGVWFLYRHEAALESTSEALRQEVGPLGIRVAIVQPGPFRTDFAGRSLQQSAEPIAAYAETAGRRRKETDTMDGKQAGDPVKAAQAILTLAEQENPPMRLVLGKQALELAEVDLNQQLDDLMDWEHLGINTDQPRWYVTYFCINSWSRNYRSGWFWPRHPPLRRLRFVYTLFIPEVTDAPRT